MAKAMRTIFLVGAIGAGYLAVLMVLALVVEELGWQSRYVYRVGLGAPFVISVVGLVVMGLRWRW